jgi:hypothetical protein
MRLLIFHVVRDWRGWLVSVAIALAACAESQAPTSVVQEARAWGVCISVPSPYRLSTEQVLDFYLHEISDRRGRRMATIYVGHNPDVDPDLTIRERRREYAARRLVPVSPTDDHPGVQFLGVPADADTAYFHVMFGAASADQQQEILDMIAFCPEAAPSDEQ